MSTTSKIDEYFQREMIGTNSIEKKELWEEEFQIQKITETFYFHQFSIFCQVFIMTDFDKLTFCQ